MTDKENLEFRVVLTWTKGTQLPEHSLSLVFLRFGLKREK